MKALVGILAVLLATTFSTLAGEPERDPQRLERVQQSFQELNVRLSLTPEQAAQVRPVLADMIEIMKAVRDDYGVENQSRRSRRRMSRELRAIRSHADARLKQVLSRAQMEELRKIRREWRDEFRGVVASGTR